jgi:hypothetical protein
MGSTYYSVPMTATILRTSALSSSGCYATLDHCDCQLKRLGGGDAPSPSPSKKDFV